MKQQSKLALTAVAATLLSACSSMHMSVEDYTAKTIDQKNELAFDLTARDAKISVDYTLVQSAMDKEANRVHLQLVNPIGVLHTRYGYSAMVQPFFDFYQKGEFEKALAYGGYMSSTVIVEHESNESELVKNLEYRQRLEHTQTLLDNGYFASAIKVASPILEEISSENGRDKFEEIQLLNELIIAKALDGKKGFTNDAKRVNSFQQDEYRKYEEELKKEGPKTDETSNGVIASLAKLFKTDSYNESVKLAKKVHSPYVNSTADFLVAYSTEVEYNESIKNGEVAEWDNVPREMKRVSKNVVSGKRSFKKVVSAVKKAPKNMKVVYALIATDIAPAKELIYTKIPAGLNLTSVGFSNLSLVPAKTTVKSVTLNGQELSVIASPEASIAKNYIDNYNYNLSMQVVKSIATATASQLAVKEAKKYGGGLLGSLAGVAVTAVGDTLSFPSTEGWQTLPANVYATRLVVPVDTKTVTVKVNGQLVTEIAIPDLSVSLIYARATDKKINTFIAKPLTDGMSDLASNEATDAAPVTTNTQG